MSYKNYKELLERYDELDSINFDGIASKEELIQKLISISKEKKEIQIKNNDIVKEYIIKYEKSPTLVDAEAEAMLKDFLSMLLSDPAKIIDPPIAFCISQILLQYYQVGGTTEQVISMLEYCTVFEIMLKEHLDDNEGSFYATMAGRYIDDFDNLSERAARSLTNCWLLSVINRKDMTAALKKYPEIKKEFGRMRRKMGEQFMLSQFIMCQTNTLAFALEACRRAAYADKYKVQLHEPMIDLAKAAPLIAELRNDLETILDSENASSLITDKVTSRMYCVQAAYHLGELSLEELLEKLEEYSKPVEEHNAIEQCSALFTANAYYMDYLYKCSQYDDQYILDKSMQIVNHVLETSKNMVHQFGNYQINSCVLMFVNSASNIVDFDFFKSTVLDATVYANKALYVHTLMVKEICLTILQYILEHNPQYLDGVGGHSYEYCAEHPREILDLMENCALFHDIGKYFCLDYVSNSSRNLTDDEFEIIKAHPANFSKIYQRKMNPTVECVHDCALLHHVWYNGQGGYPKEVHTKNQPFVNILSIADSIDAATDNIGRPYGLGKTLEQLMAEFDSMKDTRYSGYICDLLHVEEIKQKITYIITKKRIEIYYNAHQ